ncbi:MAG: serine hydrolase domain-containing protein, partial [Cyclobacteriaceae bacterium]
MKTIFLVVCNLIAIVVYPQSVDKRFAKIDKELNEVLTTWNAPGFAVAVVEKDKIIYAKGFGYRDYENKVPADANTLYAIGSCTKSFTSSLLGILRKDKLVSFDESPRKYIPYLKFHNDQMDNDIIVKDLMTHRTGLPRHDLSWYMSNTTNRDSLMMRVQYMEPFAGVREKWYYNNFMFLAQGVIAEKITGKSWEENISQYFLKPLGMSRSNAGIQEMKDASNAALGYGLKDNKINKLDYYDISGMAPAGSINSSVNDMANWVITWINGGKYKGKEIIPADYVTEAMSSQMVIAGA